MFCWASKFLARKRDWSFRYGLRGHQARKKFSFVFLFFILCFLVFCKTQPASVIKISFWFLFFAFSVRVTFSLPFVQGFPTAPSFLRKHRGSLRGRPAMASSFRQTEGFLQAFSLFSQLFGCFLQKARFSFSGFRVFT